MTYPIPPNTRAVGTPDPAGDMDKVSSLLAFMTHSTPGSSVSSAPYGRSATFTVAAHNSSTLSKLFADYLCTGAMDELTINDAVNALPGGAGRVVLLEGNFKRSGSVVIDSDYVIIDGQGVASSIVATSAGVTGPAIIVGNTHTLTSSGVKNLQVNDSGATEGTPAAGSTHGIVFACYGAINQNVNVQATAGDCFHYGQDLVNFALSTTTTSTGSFPFTSIGVTSTTGFASAGALIIKTASGPVYVEYTGTSGGNTFTGCTTNYQIGASLSGGETVVQPTGLLGDITPFNCYAQFPGGNGFYFDWTHSSIELFACRADGNFGGKPSSTGTAAGFLLYGTQIKLSLCHAYYWNGNGLRVNDKFVYTGGAITVFGGEWETNAATGVFIWNPSSNCYLNGLQFYGNGLTGHPGSDVQLGFGTKVIRLTGCTFRKGPAANAANLSQNIYMQGSSYVYIDNCEFDYPFIARAVFVDGSGAAGANACSDIFVRSSRCTGTFSGTNFVLLNGEVTNSEVSGNTTDASIVEATAGGLTPDSNIIRNNTIVPGYSAAITTLGPNTRAYDNPGSGGVEQGWRQTTQVPPYTALWGDSVWASGPGTITSAAATVNSRFRVKNATSGTVTVAAATGTIDGSGTYPLATLYQSAEFESDGTNWSVVT